MQIGAEIPAIVGSQAVGVVILLAVLKTEVKNLTGWLKSTSASARETRDLTMELKGHVEALPCNKCDVT